MCFWIFPLARNIFSAMKCCVQLQHFKLDRQKLQAWCRSCQFFKLIIRNSPQTISVGSDGFNWVVVTKVPLKLSHGYTVYPKKYAHGFVVLCFVVVIQSFIMNSHEVFIHIHQGCFAGTGAIVRLPQCQWSKPDGYGKISQCITTTKHSKAKTVCIFLGIYCTHNYTHNFV